MRGPGPTRIVVAMTTTTFTRTASLSEETLVRFRERAADHDAAGRYAVEDLADLRAPAGSRLPCPKIWAASA